MDFHQHADDSTPPDIDDVVGAIINSDTAATLHDNCVAAAPWVGSATGTLYGYGAGTISGGNPTVEDAVGDTIEHFVTNHFPDVCGLPANLYDQVQSAFEADQISASDYTWPDAFATDAGFSNIPDNSAPTTSEHDQGVDF